MARGSRSGKDPEAPSSEKLPREPEVKSSSYKSSRQGSYETTPYRAEQAGGRSGKEKKPKLTRAEAGRLGGLKTKELYGTAHYREIGKQGGAKGGATTKERYGTEHYRKIGSLRRKPTEDISGS
jgi:general stress protein YciG